MQIKILCPSCGKWLLSVTPETVGTVEVFCKRCKRPRKIKLPLCKSG